MAFSCAENETAIADEVLGWLLDRLSREEIFHYQAAEYRSSNDTDAWERLKSVYGASHVAVVLLGQRYRVSPYCEWEWTEIAPRIKGKEYDRFEIVRVDAGDLPDELIPRGLGPHRFRDYAQTNPREIARSIFDKLNRLGYPLPPPSRLRDIPSGVPPIIRRHAPSAASFIAGAPEGEATAIACNAIRSLAARIGVADQWRKKRSVLESLRNIKKLAEVNPGSALSHHELFRKYDQLVLEIDNLLALFLSPSDPAAADTVARKVHRLDSYFQVHVGRHQRTIELFCHLVRTLLSADGMSKSPEDMEDLTLPMARLNSVADSLAGALESSLMSPEHLKLLSSGIDGNRTLYEALEAHWRKLEQAFTLERQKE